MFLVVVVAAAVDTLIQMVIVPLPASQPNGIAVLFAGTGKSAPFPSACAEEGVKVGSGLTGEAGRLVGIGHVVSRAGPVPILPHPGHPLPSPAPVLTQLPLSQPCKTADVPGSCPFQDVCVVGLEEGGGGGSGGRRLGEEGVFD